MIKKISSLIAIMILGFSLTACGNSEEENSGSENSKIDSENRVNTTPPENNVPVSQESAEDTVLSYFAALISGEGSKACELLSDKLKLDYGGSDCSNNLSSYGKGITEDIDPNMNLGGSIQLELIKDEPSEVEIFAFLEGENGYGFFETFTVTKTDTEWLITRVHSMG